ncbi:MAG: ATP-binding protein [Chlamydiae bacterium]|nr:ATP-binding protein [Chlamydiota bacterium]
MKGAKQFKADFSDLDEILDWVRDVFESFDELEKAKKFEIAVEEAVVNVVHYAYHGSSPGNLYLSYVMGEERFDFEIKDQGKPFNPLENPKSFDEDAVLEEREIGGLGIHFILKMTDAATYKRVDGSNILTLSFHLKKKV